MNYDMNDMIDIMLKDKKNERDEIHFILIDKIGKAYKKAVPKSLIISALEKI